MEQTIEEIYQKKSQHEHILDRPDTYVGSIEKCDKSLYLFDRTDSKFREREITYVPGLYKIFDELIVNAADNFRNSRNMTRIEVNINKEQGFISVLNNGKGIPAQIHKTYKIYVAELIFGHLLTSTNYNDTEERVTGGRNGYGAKLTNIFSRKFVVECSDKKKKRMVKITWRNNMLEKDEPEITQYTAKEDFVKVTFWPDFQKFKMTHLEQDTYDLFEKRVYDLAGVMPSKLSVFLNSEQIQIKDFHSYSKMYLPPDTETAVLKTDRWEAVVALSDGEFRQVSFVNSINTIEGGSHVAHVVDNLTKKLIEEVKKKHKKMRIKAHFVKAHMTVFINALIVNPSFKSQTKETLSSKVADFGSRFPLQDSFIKKIIKLGIVDQIIMLHELREQAKLGKELKTKKRSRLVGVEKLDDANKAGSAESSKCTLIVTEGDSAKTLAMTGLEVAGREYFGVFPLRGKLINVRSKSISTSLKNAEVQAIIKIIGLQVGKKYDHEDSLKELRYGKLMIMADQDHDGSHIKGLVINLIHHFWPDLFRKTGFLIEFVTPIIKITKGKTVLPFFSIGEYDEFCSAPDFSLKGWKIKYYKGLGTSENEEAHEYFTNIDRHRIPFEYTGQADDQAIDLAFSQKKADQRKEWLRGYQPGVYLDHNIDSLKYTDFVDKELIQYSMASNARAIPSLVDGFKTGQRKILYGCFKRNLKSEVKVAQLVGYIAEHSSYHHGEQSLVNTIINLAQDYVGSNNINLLLPKGQFGSRAMAGKDHASGRYIFTMLNKITRFIFKEEDDHILEYLEDDGDFVEPKYYIPIIPMVFVNGCKGLGTGWMTEIPCFNPRDIIKNIKGKLEGRQFENMVPWYRGYNGRIEVRDKIAYAEGSYEVNHDMGSLEILEIPVAMSTSKFKEGLIKKWDDKNEQYQIDDIKEYHTSLNIHFRVEMEGKQLDDLEDTPHEKVVAHYGLRSKIHLNHLVLFDRVQKLQEYDDQVQIFEQFYAVRIDAYKLRKKYLLSKIQRDVDILEQKNKFILAVCDQTLVVTKRKKKELIREMVDQGFRKMSSLTKVFSNKLKVANIEEIKKEASNLDGEEEVAVEDEEDSESKKKSKENDLLKEYDYLVGMSIWSLTYEMVEKLKRQIQEKKVEYQEIEAIGVKEMYRIDLDLLVDKLEKMEIEQQKTIAKKDKKLKKAPSKKGKKARKNRRKRKTEKKIDDYVGKERNSSKKVGKKKVKKIVGVKKGSSPSKELKGTNAYQLMSEGDRKELRFQNFGEFQRAEKEGGVSFSLYERMIYGEMVKKRGDGVVAVDKGQEGIFGKPRSRKIIKESRRESDLSDSFVVPPSRRSRSRKIVLT